MTVVALIVTPALCMLLLTGRGRLGDGAGAAAHDRDPPVVRWTRGRYENLLRGIATHPTIAIAAALAFTLAGSAALPFFGSAFLPELKEGHFILHMSAVPGTSIAESQRLGALVTKALTDLPVVRAQRIGRAEKADDTWGTHYSECGVCALIPA